MVEESAVVEESLKVSQRHLQRLQRLQSQVAKAVEEALQRLLVLQALQALKAPLHPAAGLQALAEEEAAQVAEAVEEGVGVGRLKVRQRTMETTARHSLRRPSNIRSIRSVCRLHR